MAVSPAGFGTGLDVNGIVEQLMAVERRPFQALAERESSYKAKISAYGSIQNDLSSLRTALSGLSTLAGFNGLSSTVSDPAVASVTTTSSAVAGSYSLEVTKLAQAQKLVAAGQTSTSARIGTGTISFEFGEIAGGSFDPATGKYAGASFTANPDGVKTVTIGEGNSSLAGIRDAINSAKIGVTAAIVNDGGSAPNRLVLTNSATGKQQSMRISVSGESGLETLLGHDPEGAQGLTQTIAAQNAEFKIDGLAATSATNSVENVIPGGVISLLKANPGTSVTVKLDSDTSAITAGVSKFVAAFNQVTATINRLTAYNAGTNTASALTGDATVRSIQTSLKGLLGSALPGGTGAYTVLSQVGISLQKDGTLALNETKLKEALNTNLSSVAALFASNGVTSDPQVRYAGVGSSTKAGTYAIDVSSFGSGGTAKGSGAPSLTVSAGVNDTLDVLLNGTSASITLSAKTYSSSAELAAEIQSRINAAAAFQAAGFTASVGVDGDGALKITSDKTGSASAVDVTGGSARTSIFGSISKTAGSGLAATIDGVAARVNGDTIVGADGTNATGLRLTITGGSTGSRGTVTVTRGFAAQMTSIIDGMLGDEGALASRRAGLNASIKDVTDSAIRLEDRLALVEQRYRAQFAALDAALGSMSQTSSYLASQLASLA